MTKQNILKHKERFALPAQPRVTHRCQHLMASLIQDRENRLCSKRYRFKDLCASSISLGGHRLPVATSANSQSASRRGSQDFAGRYVFPYDAEDIKAHKWFHGLSWEHLHQLSPPLVPQIKSDDDSHYFDQEAEISDWSKSQLSEASANDEVDLPHHVTSMLRGNPQQSTQVMDPRNMFVPGQPNDPFVDTGMFPADLRAWKRNNEAQKAQNALSGLRQSIQRWAMTAIVTPFDAQRLRNLDMQIDAWAHLTSHERALLRQFVRTFGKREKKRPRDRLLRDRNTRSVAMDVRRKTAFLGYTWRRMRPWSETLAMSELFVDHDTLHQREAQMLNDGDSGHGLTPESASTNSKGVGIWGGDACRDWGRFDYPAMLALHRPALRRSWQ